MERILFEILPPPQTWSDDRVAKYCQQVVAMLKQQNVLSVGLPEVVNEIRGHQRRVGFSPKIDNVQFALMLKHHHHTVVPILYKICVRISKQYFADWLGHVYEKGIRHVVLVGAESHADIYHGYSVIEAAHYIRQHYPDMKIGGITIFTRAGEAGRLIDKMQGGIEFFISQIIFEAANMKQILLNISKILHVNALISPKIYLSLALASKNRDIEFMKWLGVEFPTAIYGYLTEDHKESVEVRSTEVVDMMLDEIFHFINKEKIDIGFNIEHVMYTNLLLSQKLLNNIRKRLAQS